MKHQVRIRLIYGIFLSVFTVALGLALIIEAAQIYYGGEGYSRAAAGEKLFPLIVPFALYIVAVCGGFVLSVVFPAPAPREHAGKEVALRRLRARLPVGEGEEFEAERKKLRTLEGVRIGLWGLCAALSLAAAIATICRLAAVGRFAGEVTGAVLGMLRFCLPFIGTAFVAAFAAALYEGLTLDRRLSCVKRLLLLGRGNPSEEQSGAVLAAERALGVLRSDIALWVIRGAVLLLGVLFIVLGAVNGGATDVYLKAIKICTECIGLG